MQSKSSAPPIGCRDHHPGFILKHGAHTKKRTSTKARHTTRWLRWMLFSLLYPPFWRHTFSRWSPQQWIIVLKFCFSFSVVYFCEIWFWMVRGMNVLEKLKHLRWNYLLQSTQLYLLCTFMSVFSLVHIGPQQYSTRKQCFVALQLWRVLLHNFDWRWKSSKPMRT